MDSGNPFNNPANPFINPANPLNNPANPLNNPANPFINPGMPDPSQRRALEEDQLAERRRALEEAAKQAQDAAERQRRLGQQQAQDTELQRRLDEQQAQDTERQRHLEQAHRDQGRSLTGNEAFLPDTGYAQRAKELDIILRQWDQSNDGDLGSYEKGMLGMFENPEDHHIFPQNKMMKNWFAERGVNVHKFTVTLSELDHDIVHRWWNQKWKDFMAAESSEVRYTRDQIEDQAAQMMEDAGILDSYVHNYRNPNDGGRKGDEATSQ